LLLLYIVSDLISCLSNIRLFMYCRKE
jgi:hypothetical protein